MTEAEVTGRFRARFGGSVADVAAAQALRHLCFRGRAGRDADILDDAAEHLMVEAEDGALVGTARLVWCGAGGGLSRTYAARYYRLDGLERLGCAMVEMGRFCMHPAYRDADLLRMAWGALAARVVASGAGMMIGATSFAGTDPATAGDAFAYLRARHLGPEALRPMAMAPETVPFDVVRGDAARGRAVLPPLLRSYLAMGGWVGDHAVIDRDLGTMHVFTALDVAAVPAARVRSLLAGDLAGLQPGRGRNS